MWSLYAPMHQAAILLAVSAMVTGFALLLYGWRKAAKEPRAYDERETALQNIALRHGFYTIILLFLVIDHIAEKRNADSIERAYVLLMMIGGYGTYLCEMILRGVRFHGPQRLILFTSVPMFSVSLILCLLAVYGEEPLFTPPDAPALVLVGTLAGLLALLFLCGLIRLAIDRREKEDE